MNERDHPWVTDAKRDVRILLADDHDVVRQGLRRLLEEQARWTVCGEARNGREAVRLCQELMPDIAILDVSMPELNGLEATRQIRKVSPATEILVFTMHQSEQLVRDMLTAGARGYLLKSDAAANIVDAISSLAAHRPYFNMRVSETVLAGYLQLIEKENHATRQKPGDTLTAREREILQLLAEGKANKEVARQLSIGVKTVEAHRASIMRKIGANSIVDIVRYAVRNQIVEF
jgi:DNA-binding NarL/FixJ family response regulator